MRNLFLFILIGIFVIMPCLQAQESKQQQNCNCEELLKLVQKLVKEIQEIRSQLTQLTKENAEAQKKIQEMQQTDKERWGYLECLGYPECPGWSVKAKAAGSYWEEGNWKDSVTFEKSLSLEKPGNYLVIYNADVFTGNTQRADQIVFRLKTETQASQPRGTVGLGGPQNQFHGVVTILHKFNIQKPQQVQVQALAHVESASIQITGATFAYIKID